MGGVFCPGLQGKDTKTGFCQNFCIICSQKLPVLVVKSSDGDTGHSLLGCGPV